jgi:ubiquinone/menaquinone biosynthesis C-methylase UbiE
MGEQECETGWSDVDRTGEPGYFLDYLDRATALEFFQAYKRESYGWVEARVGHHILDIGCGTGDDVLALARLVGNTGRSVGIDNSETLICEANKRAEGLNLPVEFQVGDAHCLDFADNVFDGCRADRVFQHLPDREQALAEMIRVARPGARIAANDADWETLVIDSPDRDLTRRILNHHCDNFTNGWSGRQLPALFKRAGVLDIVVYTKNLILTDFAVADQLYSLQVCAEELQEAGTLTSREANEWVEQLKQASEAGLFFCAVTGFAASGRKP